MNKEDELFIAKKTAERAGYKVTMPAPRHMSSAEYDARKNGQPVPSFADRLERLALAARTAEEAGYTIRKMTAADRAAPAAPPAEEKPKTPAWLANASHFMGKED